MIKNLICLCGERRRGKDYLASVLINKSQYVRLSFSDEVRRLANVIYPWFKPFTVPDDQKELEYVHPYNTEHKSTREILLTAGRARDVDGAYFVRAFEQNQMSQVRANPDTQYIITDLRTPQEEEFLRGFGIPIIKVTRDIDIEPHPFEDWVRAFQPDYAFHNTETGEDNIEKFLRLIDKIKGT